MFTHRNIPSSEDFQKFGIISTPAPRYAGLSLDRPPERREPPSWWQGERCGECVDLESGTASYQWWKNISHDDDLIPVQMVRDDTTVGGEVRKYSRCEVDGKSLNSLQLRRLAGQLKIAADLLDG